MNNDSQEVGFIDKFLLGLKHDIQTREVSLDVAFKWTAILFIAYFIFPLVVLGIIWIIWKKTSWDKSKRWVVTALLLAGYGWFLSMETYAVPQGNDTDTTTANTQKAELKTGVDSAVSEKEDLYLVESVVDGDTIKVSIDGALETLRLIGMDTPETVDPRKPVQCFGKEASNKAKEKLLNKKVSLEADPTQGERDKYNRLLRYAFLEDGTFYNKWMIEEGYAHEYTYQSNPYKYQTEFIEVQKSARENKRGLWADDTCKGDTSEAAIVAGAIVGGALVGGSVSDSQVVKKSSTGICHAPGTTYYARTKNFTSYDSLDDCLQSGGRMPKR